MSSLLRSPSSTTNVRVPGSSAAAARDLLLLAAACTLVYVASAGHPPLGTSVRYYEAAREMRELGDWTVPHLGYAPYGEKPPLVYWLGAAARWFGDGARAASLPSLLATIVSVACAWGLGRAVRSRGLGLGAALLLLGTSFEQAMAGVLITDTLLAASTALAWWAFWEWEQSGRVGRVRLLGFYAAVGVGWMAKGPVALLLPVVGVGLYALLADGWRGALRCLRRMQPAAGLVVIVAMNAPWTLAWWVRDPRLVEFFYVRINLDSFLSGSYNHPNPWWYYGPVLVGSLMPFAGLALPALCVEWWRGLRGSARRGGGGAGAPDDRSRLYLTCCTLGPLLFFSASSAKLGTYLMPLMPPMAVLVAMRIVRWSRAPRWVAAVAAVQTAAMLLVLATAAALLPSAMRTHRLVLFGRELMQPDVAACVEWRQAWIAVAAAAMMGLGSIGLLVGTARHRLNTGLAALALCFMVATSLLLGGIHRLVPHWDTGSLVGQLRARGGDDPSLPPERRDPVLLDNSTVQDYSILLALGRRAGIVGRSEETGLGHFLQAHPDGSFPIPGSGQTIAHPYDVSGENTAHPWLWSRDRLERAWNGEQRVWLIIKQGAIPRLESRGLTVIRIAHVRDTWLVSNKS